MGAAYSLENCVWEITLACCFSCEYCGSRGGKAREKELSTEECLDVADQLSQLGCRRVSLIGGEVFMRRDWDIIVKRLISRGMEVAIITNGYFFSLELAKKIKTMGIESVAISLDGTEEIHDRYRQRGSFRRGIEALDILAAQDIAVSVITTLHRENISCLEEFYQILKTKSICAWQLQACSPMGNAVDRGMDYHFNFKKVLKFVEGHMFQAPFALGVADNIGYFTESEGFIRGNLEGKAPFLGCKAGLSTVGIDSAGNVRGCESLYLDSFIEGNLREKTLREIWESPEAFAYNRKFRAEFLTGRCGECRYGALCAGGCRSYNYFTRGKLYESPFCARDVKGG